jgi:proteasome alpha subunit
MALGMVCKDGVLLVADRRIADKLIIPESVAKIFKVDDKIATTFSGLTSDARVLVKRTRIEAQQHKLTYGEKVDVEGIAKFVSDTEQLYTQFGGARPYGVSLLLGGHDKKGLHLFVTEPSGIYSKFRAKAIGLGATDANKLLEKRYKENITLDAARTLALEIFKEVLAAEFNLDRLEAMQLTS